MRIIIDESIFSIISVVFLVLTQEPLPTEHQGVPPPCGVCEQGVPPVNKSVN